MNHATDTLCMTALHNLCITPASSVINSTHLGAQATCEVSNGVLCIGHGETVAWHNDHLVCSGQDVSSGADVDLRVHALGSGKGVQQRMTISCSSV